VSGDAPGAAQQGYAVAAERFHAAVAAGLPIDARTYVIGSRHVRLRVIGARLASGFASAWHHLRAPVTSPGDGTRPVHVAIDLWHEAEAHIGRPADADGIDPLGRFPYQVSPDGRFLAVRQPETTVWLDRQARRIVGVVDEIDRRSLYEAGRPLEPALLVWLRDEGMALVHASFVAHGDRGALILGRSGSGKSTLAAECLCAGFDYLGDDKIAFAQEGPGVFLGYSLNASLHVDSGALRRLPALAGHAIRPRLSIDDKFRIPVEELGGGRLRASAPIRALIIPTRRDGSSGRVEPASKRAALLALSLSTLLSLPMARQRSLDELAALADAVPAYGFDLTHAADAPERLAALLASV
jgi:hypothetical protein